MFEIRDGCWPWFGRTNWKGYGIVRLPNRSSGQAHRWLYQQVYGAIAPTLTLDHLCGNRACVRPDHLEPVTPRTNTLRGDGPAARNARKTHCIQGHPLADARKILGRSGQPWRICVHCERSRSMGAVLSGYVPPALRTHCPQGHPYDAENTRVSAQGRKCRECGRAGWRNWKRKQQANAA